MSVFPFQSNPTHTRNVRRAFTERRANEFHNHLGVNHMPCLHHSKSSEARLDQLAAHENDELTQGKHHLHLTHQQQLSKSDTSIAKLPKSPSHENIIMAFTRPEAWKLSFGSQEGGFKFDSITLGSNGNLNNRK